MTRREIATLACRILALYMLLRAFDGLAASLPAAVSNVYSRLTSDFSGDKSLGYVAFAYIIPAFLSPVMNALAALVLWRASDRVALALVGKDSGGEIKTNLSANEILFLTFSILGVMSCVYFAAWIAFLFGNALTSQFPQQFGWNGETFFSCVHFALSLALLLGARPLANMIEANGRAKSVATIETA